MESLRELTGQYLALLEFGLSTDPEEQEAFETTLDSINFEVGLKADQYADVIAAFESRAFVCDEEAGRLEARAESLRKAARTMKDRLLDSMRAMDKTKIETDLHTFRRRKAGGKQGVLIVDPHAVPGEYCRIITEPDKDKIRTALESGKELPFASLKERGEYLKID